MRTADATDAAVRRYRDMCEPVELLAGERDILRRALESPLLDSDPTVMKLCMTLQARRLLQRAGAISLANGWRGSPHAFLLTCEGWRLLKAERRRAPIRCTG
jgi:CRP-like cAMP-binding protein